MGFRIIKYKKKQIKVLWENCGDCHAIFYPDSLILRINPNLSKQMMAQTLFHELWHIICWVNKININKIGEEKTALLAEEFIHILKSNNKLRKLINEYLR